MPLNMRTNTFTSSQASFPHTPPTHSSQCPAAASIDGIKHRLTPLTFLLCASLSTQTGPLAPVAIMTTTSTVTTPTAVKELAKKEHITSSLRFLLEPYLPFLHTPDTYTQPRPWLSNNCSISAPIPQHNPSTYRSLLIQHLAITITAHTPPSGQISTSLLGHRLHPRPTNLKTFST